MLIYQIATWCSLNHVSALGIIHMTLSANQDPGIVSCSSLLRTVCNIYRLLLYCAIPLHIALTDLAWLQSLILNVRAWVTSPEVETSHTCMTSKDDESMHDVVIDDASSSPPVVAAPEPEPVAKEPSHVYLLGYYHTHQAGKNHSCHRVHRHQLPRPQSSQLQKHVRQSSTRPTGNTTNPQQATRAAISHTGRSRK